MPENRKGKDMQTQTKDSVTHAYHTLRLDPSVAARVRIMLAETEILSKTGLTEVEILSVQDPFAGKLVLDEEGLDEITLELPPRYLKELPVCVLFSTVQSNFNVTGGSPKNFGMNSFWNISAKRGSRWGRVSRCWKDQANKNSQQFRKRQQKK